jgi:hypothetical protein
MACDTYFVTVSELVWTESCGSQRGGSPEILNGEHVEE